MLILMAHDNKQYPLKAMKASQLPRLNREKTQYTLEQLQKAKDLIAERAAELMAGDTSLESIDYTYKPWKDDLEQDDKVGSMKHRLSL